MTLKRTIAALATGAGRAGVAVLRVSGPAAEASLAALTGREGPKPFTAEARLFRRPATGEPIDFGLALFMPPPNNYTGEPIAEFMVHGGPAIVASMLDALTSLPDVRLAEPGEFTRRAFENGKLDLTKAEALADLVDAETEGQRRQALRQYRGALEKRIEGWRRTLIEISALMEAEIDFPDEEVPEGVAEGARAKIAHLTGEFAAFLADAHRGERVREGFRIAIIGAPNVGKSSLLNALAQREAAIVSDIPGTTRDVVEVRLVLAGFPVWIADTAGLREASDQIEAEGVRRALERARDADLRIAVIDGGVSAKALSEVRQGDLVVLNKIDLAPPESHGITHRISARTGEGMPALIATLEARVVQALGAEEAAPLTRARHRAQLEEAHAALLRADQALALGPELAAEDVRLAARALGRLTGRIDVEDILGEIFARFCIGK
ncbi:MAG: tRNA uridine-5-carboxymethylaminomethyl(34) synthesis GTPase MnmE [Hyphomonadaceae bacterium]|nr:tRNA uridine-5-carboxymethylaminomethyl(34) synthesis GTPase MnmE [Hyphomonadaceae bacterium]